MACVDIDGVDGTHGYLDIHNTIIVVVGSDLHDENIPIMEYAKGFRNRLEHMCTHLTSYLFGYPGTCSALLMDTNDRFNL